MSNARKIAIGLGLAGGALLAAYLLTGDRKQRTKEFISKAGKKIKDTLDPKTKPANEDSDVTYI